MDSITTSHQILAAAGRAPVVVGPYVDLNSTIAASLVTFGPDPVNGIDFVDGGLGPDEIVVTGVNLVDLGFTVGSSVIIGTPNNAANNVSEHISGITTTWTTNDTLQVITGTLTADVNDTSAYLVKANQDAQHQGRGILADAAGISVELARNALTDQTGEALGIDLGEATALFSNFVDDGRWAIHLRMDVVTVPGQTYWWAIPTCGDSTISSMGCGYCILTGFHSLSGVSQTQQAGGYTANLPFDIMLIPGSPGGKLGVAAGFGANGPPVSYTNYGFTWYGETPRSGAPLRIFLVFGIRSTAGAPNVTGKVSFAGFARQWRP